MKNPNKSSFTIIELVVAIIVIGIAVSSIPMMLATVSQSSSTHLKSTSFYNAYATLALIESMDWDENNTKGDNFYKVLKAKDGDSYLKCQLQSLIPLKYERNGTYQLNNESGADCATLYNETSSIGVDVGENKDDSSTFDDVDDFDGYKLEVADYNLTVSVKYIKDNANYSDENIFYNDSLETSNNTNIKEIEINVTDKKGKLISIIRGKSFNIGRVKMYSKSL